MKYLSILINREAGVITFERHYLNGKLHRDPKEGAAFIGRTNEGEIAVERYYWHGRLHRDDGPAWLVYNIQGALEEEGYYRHGALHRDPEQGPAWIEREGTRVIGTTYAVKNMRASPEESAPSRPSPKRPRQAVDKGSSQLNPAD